MKSIAGIDIPEQAPRMVGIAGNAVEADHRVEMAGRSNPGIDRRCAHTFMFAICIAATVIFWLPQSVLSLDAYNSMRCKGPE